MRMTDFAFFLSRIPQNYANCSADGGVSWHSPQLIQHDVDYEVFEPQVRISGRNAVATWTGQRWIQHDDGTYYPHFAVCGNYTIDGGVTWNSDQLIQDNATDIASAISERNIAVTYEVRDEGGEHVYVNNSIDAGALWNMGMSIGQNQLEQGSVAISGNNAVLVWVEIENVRRIYSSRSANGGIAWDLKQPIADVVEYDTTNPSVAISGENVVVVWYDYDGREYGLCTNYSTDGGTAWHTKQLLEGVAGFFQSEPKVAISGRSVIVVWPYDNGGGTDLHAAYSIDGGAAWSAIQVIARNVEIDSWSLPFEPRLAISGASATVIWSNGTGNDCRIYAKSILLPSKGDVSCSGDVNIADAMLCLRMALWLPIKVDGETYDFPYPEELRLLADMDSDEMVSILDTIACLRQALNPAGQ